MTTTTRLAILLAIDVFFVAVLAILLVWGGGLQTTAIIAGIAMIGYVTYSIVQLRAKAKQEKLGDHPAPPAKP